MRAEKLVEELDRLVGEWTGLRTDAEVLAWAHRHAIAIDAVITTSPPNSMNMIGAAGNRPRLVEPLSHFVRQARIPFFNTQMGKGAVTGGSNLYLGTAALSERDYVHDAIDSADLIIAIGHDTIEKPPFIMGPKGPKVIHVGYTPANVEEVYFPDAEVIGASRRQVPSCAAGVAVMDIMRDEKLPHKQTSQAN